MMAIALKLALELSLNVIKADGAYFELALFKATESLHFLSFSQALEPLQHFEVGTGYDNRLILGLLLFPLPLLLDYLNGVDDGVGLQSVHNIH